MEETLHLTWFTCGVVCLGVSVSVVLEYYWYMACGDGDIYVDDDIS